MITYTLILMIHGYGSVVMPGFHNLAVCSGAGVSIERALGNQAQAPVIWNCVRIVK